MSTFPPHQKEVFLILHDIRSALNVGALFRTADAVGVSKIYCTGYTPTPLDRFGRARQDIAKAALGAEVFVSWEYAAEATDVVERLKKQGVQIVALEQSLKSIDYKELRPKDRCAVVVGNEREGVSPDLLKLADVAIYIPMKGQKESLNVTTAAGVALFRMLGI